ncbi:MAG: DUF5110 domain-containing protein [Clostridia bacterium]|nr:DUF5110 domain-containing protein [Clostridia bacterium]
MKEFWDNFFYTDDAAADESQIVLSKEVRFTVLTPYMLRVETQLQGQFCDLATQSVVNRRFDAPKYTVAKENNYYKIRTEKCAFCYDIKEKKMLYVALDDGRRVKEYDIDNLKGTCRTLDGTNGKTKLGDGVLSKNGVAILDDTGTLNVSNTGDITPRQAPGTDKYYFAYGNHYQEAVRDFFRLTGMPPLIPRFAFGNWWSRYKAYTQEEYTALMKEFIDRKIPLSVATIDMDWHWVKVVEKFGEEARDRKKKKGVLEIFYNLINPGWTGYSWNTDLFPTPKEFLQFLKDADLKITMNLHPASGCKFYEDAYNDFCAFMGVDPATKEQIRFNIADKKYMEGYFKYLHHPHEEDGVDFWWIDWQQGTKSGIKGLDPLWALNHYHYLDNGRDGKRPLILSRFAGAGSHRYPLGFSGDSAQTWSTLDFQPYFTSTASNIGYTWWSHDIGGHHMGERDDELYLRWVQFGVFSPIMRLHSTANEFMGKEPWKYRADVEYFASEAMRLRHKLVPYIYTMNRLTHRDGLPLIRPMYYLYPDKTEAYGVPNEYLFGTELIVCPITEKIDNKAQHASVRVWLPEGRYTDLFTGRIYQGGRMTTLCRDESSIPVLAKEGAILPLAADVTHNGVPLPETLEVLVYRGNNSFTLYEDDGETMEYERGAYAETAFEVKENDGNVTFAVRPAEGDRSVLPEKRGYSVVFKDIVNAKTKTIKVNGQAADEAVWSNEHGLLRCELCGLSPADLVEIELTGFEVLKNRPLRDHKVELLSKLQGSNLAKKRYERLLDVEKSASAPSELKNAFEELSALWYEE